MSTLKISALFIGVSLVLLDGMAFPGQALARTFPPKGQVSKNARPVKAETAQHKPPQARALLLSGSEGVEAKALRYEQGQFRMVGKSDKFSPCDLIKIEFASTVDGYVYFVNLTPGGKLKTVYREAVEKGRNYTLPKPTEAGGSSEKFKQVCEQRLRAEFGNTEYEGLGRENFIWFDNEPGVEVLRLILSKKKIAVLDQSYDNEIPVASGNPAKENRKRPKNNSDIIEPVRPGDGACRGLNLRCRSLGFEPPDPKNNKTAVAVPLPHKGQALSMLNDGDAIVVEFRFSHINERRK